MVRSLILVSSAALLATVTHAELQLAPDVLEYRGDGTTLKRLAFCDTGKTVTYQPPHGWTYSGTPKQLTLRPPRISQTDVTVTRVSLSRPGTFDEESLKKLVTDVVAHVPKGCENPHLVSQEKNPLKIQGKETFLITIAYSIYGENCTRSVLFLNRGNEQIRSQLTCRQADFNELQRAFLRSQYTWQNL